MKSLLEKYEEHGLKILLFPCNQFMNQEPNTNEVIKNWINSTHPANYLLFEKIDVNGKFLLFKNEI